MQKDTEEKVRTDICEKVSAAPARATFHTVNRLNGNFTSIRGCLT